MTAPTQTGSLSTGARAAAVVTLILLALALPMLTTGCLDPCANCSSGVAPGGPGTFISTGPLHENRAFAASALIPSSGNVLVAGGGRLPGYLTRSEIIDPANGSVSLDAELTTARANHTATLLGDGTVLLTGGDNGIEALNSAELFHPPTSGGPGNFTQVGSMFAPRTHHTATLLRNGKVLITGGSPAVVTQAGGDVLPSGALNSAELYDPSSGAFLGVLQAMTVARTGHTATLLNDGTVLIAGGVDQNGTALATAEIFDPHTQSFTPTGSLNAARFDHTATLINCGKGCSFNGEVLIAGGFDNSLETDSSTSHAEVYSPTDGAFHPGFVMVTGRAFHSAIDLADGSVLLAGGLTGDPTNGFTNLNTAEIFSPATGAFAPANGTMSAARSGAGAAAIKISGAPAVLVSFGGDADFNGGFQAGTLASTDIFSPSSGSFTPGPASPQTCPQDTNVNPQGCAITRAAHTATTLSDGRVLITGGFEATPVRFRSSEIYNVAQGTFALGPEMTEARVFESATPLTNSTAPHFGNILIAGGQPFCDGSAERFDPAANTFTAVGPMSAPSRCTFFSATQMTDGRVLLAGGLDVNNNVLNTAEIYDPATDSFTPTAGTMTSPRWGHVAVPLTDGSNEVLIVGGSSCATNNCNGFLASAELFNPATGTFTATNGPPSEARFFASGDTLTNPGTAGLPNDVLIAGGSGDNTAQLYEPSTGTFPPNIVFRMNFIRFFQTATPLQDPRGLILITGGSGRNAFNNLIPLSSAEIFDPMGSVFCTTGSMAVPRAFHAATAVGSGSGLRVLIAGGFGGNTALGTAELYRPPLEKSPCVVGGGAVTSMPGAREAVHAEILKAVQDMSR